MARPIPKFSELPLRPGDPPFSAWGLYGPDDELGTLNRLSDDVVLAAAREIQTGTRISLDWPLDALGELPLFGRQAFHKNVYQKKPRIVHDDVWTFNTQSSTQWDGLRHVAYQAEQKFYNGVTLEDIHGADGKGGSNVLGIGAMADRGIAGRGILLDYHAWRQKHGIAHEPFKKGGIKLEHLQEVAREQGVEIRFGDILFIRSGFISAYNALSDSDKTTLSQTVPPELAGVEQSEAVLEWIWDHFSAVAGDHPAFECWPTQREFLMHEVFLAGWGMPIGELFDLEKLAEHCAATGRYSFFVTSKVCNVPGGVASPPNALAIF